MGAAGLRTLNSSFPSLLLPCPPARLAELRMQPWKSPSPKPCSRRVAQSQLSRTVSRQFLNISKDRESTTSLGNLCSAWSLSQQKYFQILRGISVWVQCLCSFLILLSPLHPFPDEFCSLPSSSWRESGIHVMVMRGCYWHRLCLAGICLLVNTGKIAMKRKELSCLPSLAFVYSWCYSGVVVPR